MIYACCECLIPKVWWRYKVLMAKFTPVYRYKALVYRYIWSSLKNTKFGSILLQLERNPCFNRYTILVYRYIGRTPEVSIDTYRFNPDENPPVTSEVEEPAVSIDTQHLCIDTQAWRRWTIIVSIDTRQACIDTHVCDCRILMCCLILFIPEVH